MRNTLILLLIVCIMLSLASCSKEPVVYDLAGGTLTATLTEDSELSDIVATIPSKEGFEFAGWYSDAAYTDYINPRSITRAQQKANRAFAKWITIPESVDYDVRNEMATITDSGRAKQKMDLVPISTDYNITDLKRAGYTSLKIKVSLSLCEIDDGYQYIFLYKDENCISNDSLSDIFDKYVTGDQNDPSLLYTYQYEHTPGNVDPTWEHIEFETIISLDKVKKDLYLRYGASGSKNDDWKNDSVGVTVTPIK